MQGGERKRKNLIRLGVPPPQAYQCSRSRMGGWAIAQSPILGTTITLERLRKRGYEALLTYYEEVAPHLNEPLYTCLRFKCPVDILIEREERSSPTYSGERLSPSVITGGEVYSIVVSYFIDISNFLPNPVSIIFLNVAISKSERSFSIREI